MSIPEIPYIRYPFIIPAPDSAPTGTTNFSLNWSLNQIQNPIDNFIPHVGALYFVVEGSIVQAAGASAIRNDDWALLLGSRSSGAPYIEGQGVQAPNRSQNVLQASYLSLLRTMESIHGVTGQFGPLSQLGPNLASSGGGATTPVKLTYPVIFFNERFRNPWRYVNSAEWWNLCTLQTTFTDPTVAFGANFSWSATPTFRLVCDLYLTTAVITAAPFMWGERTNPATGSATTQINPGIYDTGGLFGPAFGGASGFCTDDLVDVLANIQNTQQPNRWPNNVTLIDWARFQNGFNPGVTFSPFGADFTGAVNPLNGTTKRPKLSTLRLFGPQWLGPTEAAKWNAYASPSDQINFSTVVNGGKTFSLQQTYYYAQRIGRKACSPQNPVGDIANNVRETLGRKVNCGESGFTPWTQIDRSEPAEFASFVSFKR